MSSNRGGGNDEASHSARGPHHEVNLDIRLRNNLICFPVSRVYFLVGEVKVFNQNGCGFTTEFAHPPDPPLRRGVREIIICVRNTWISPYLIVRLLLACFCLTIIISTGSTTIRLRTFHLRHFVRLQTFCLLLYTRKHPTSVSANNYFHQFQLLLTV